MTNLINSFIIMRKVNYFQIAEIGQMTLEFSVIEK